MVGRPVVRWGASQLVGEMPTVDGFGGAGGLGSGVTLSEGTVPSVGDGLGASDSSSDPLSLGDPLS